MAIGAGQQLGLCFVEAQHSVCKVVFHEPIPCGQYNIVISTRCGDGHDYNLRRIGHPVQAV